MFVGSQATVLQILWAGVQTQVTSGRKSRGLADTAPLLVLQRGAGTGSGSNGEIVLCIYKNQASPSGLNTNYEYTRPRSATYFLPLTTSCTAVLNTM
jgi:hypothetical protein